MKNLTPPFHITTEGIHQTLILLSLLGNRKRKGL